MGAKRRRPKGKKDTPEKRDAAERASRRTAYLELLSKTMQSDQKESGPYASCNTQYTGETAKACKKIVYETGETAMACKKILDETGETAMACKEIADLQTQLVGIQTRMLTALDPKTRVDELDEAAVRADEAAARADASVAQIDVQVDASAARIEQLERQLAEQASASVARIKELEQELKAAKAVASDAGGDKLLELLAELVASNKEIMRYSGATNASLEKIEKKPACCSIA